MIISKIFYKINTNNKRILRDVNQNYSLSFIILTMFLNCNIKKGIGVSEDLYTIISSIPSKPLNLFREKF